MTFFGALPKPLDFETKSQTEHFAIKSNKSSETKPGNLLNLEKMTAERIKFVTYDVTLENLEIFCRDIMLPFDFLSYFAETKSSEDDFSRQKTSTDEALILSKMSKLVEIKLQILNRTEKSQSLSNIPELISKCLETVNFLSFLEISNTLRDVLWTWSEAMQKSKKRPLRRKLYASANLKVFKIKSLTNTLENIFSEGLILLNKPTIMDLNYKEFQKFLECFSLSYTGPFNTNFNGQKLVAFFVTAKYHCLRFFNRNNPLYGIFEFDSLSEKKNFESLPTWFLDSPAINNYAIEKMISNFDRMSFV